MHNSKVWSGSLQQNQFDDRVSSDNSNSPSVQVYILHSLADHFFGTPCIIRLSTLSFWKFVVFFRSLMVASKYGYSVSFSGVGEDPGGTEHLGKCSQIAVFVKSEGKNGRYKLMCV